MRVHELAKELNIKSQEVIDTLNGTQFAVKMCRAVLRMRHSKLYERSTRKQK